MYFKVAPYLLGSSGTYIFTLNILRETINSDLEIQVSPSVGIYPNPAHDQLFIKCIGNNIQHIQITDLNGRLKMTHFLEQDPNEVKEIDISSLTTGIYQIEIFSTSGVETKKLIKR